MDGLRHVKAGEAVVYDAAGHNAIVDAARAHRDRQGKGRQATGGDTPPGTVLIRNSSGATINRFGVLGLSGVVISPSVNEQQFHSQPCFDGVTPSASTRNWAVLQEPLAAGAIGTAIVSGLTPVRLLVLSGEEDFNYAEVVGSTDHVRPVESGQAEILWRESGLGSKRALVRMGNTPSTGAGQVFLGIVKAPSADGSISSTYTVDIYGATIASLSEAPTIEDVVAVQSPAELRYYRAEVVGLTRSGDTWLISKLLSLPIAYTVEAQELCLRLVPADAALVPANALFGPYNFLVDLNACLSFFDGGEVTDDGFISFGFGSFGGVGRISVEDSVPVKWDASFTLVSPLSIDATFATVFATLITGTASSVASSQDTIGVTHSLAGPTVAVYDVALGDQAFAPGAFTIAASPSDLDVLNVRGRIEAVTARTNASGSSFFGGMPSLPVIPGAVNDDRYLLTTLQALITETSTATASGAVNALDPTINRFKQVGPSGTAITGTYSLFGSGGAIGGNVTVA